MSTSTKNLTDAVFESIRTQKIQRVCFVVVKQQIHVGLGCVVTAGDGAEEAQMKEAGGLQFGGVRAQDAEDAVSLHVVNVTDCPRLRNGSRRGRWDQL